MKDFINILIFLRDEMNVQITVKDFSRVMTQFPLFRKDQCFGSHLNPFCSYIKSNLVAYTHCVECGLDLHNKIQNNENISAPFWGTCYCGVREYVVPIISNGTVIAAIVSGGMPCEAERLESSFCRIEKKFDFEKARLYALYNESFAGEVPLEETAVSILHLAARQIGDYFADRTAAGVKNLILKKHQIILDTAINYIKSNLNKKLSINEIAYACDCSESLISHCFSETMGISIGKYILAKRITLAKKLVTSSNITMAEIANKCGFGSTEYFSYIFKKNVGVSASDYRKVVR